MKQFSLCALLIVLLTSFGFAQQEYSIKVKLEGGPQDKYIHLAHFLGYNQYIKVDSAKLENGVYHFEGEEPLKGGIYLIVLSSSKYYDFIYSGDEKAFEIEADTTNFVRSVQFKGSKENDILFGYRKFLDSMNDKAAAVNASIDQTAPDANKLRREKMMALQKEFKDYMNSAIDDNEGTFAAKVIKANKEIEVPTEIPLNPDGSKDSTFAFRFYKAHFWDNIDFSDDRILRTPFLQTKLEKYFKDLVFQVQDSVIVDADRVVGLSKQNPEVYRYVLWWVTNKYENSEIVGLDGVFVHLAEEYYLKDADWLSEDQLNKFKERVKILKPLRTGEVFPRLYVYDTLGKAHTVQESNAKYTIVYFYSPDCGHCKDAAPDLVEYAKKAKEKGIAIYNVSVDYELEEMKEFINKFGTGEDMLNLWDQGHHYYFRDNYDVYATPTSYILDSEKRIIGKRIPIEEFDRFIEFHERKQSSAKSK
ncbi:thioredoxin-like domain-containing protein [Jiulongibacter sp. NS-SX5]|uniref:thioredoxin-like domain-containing protein n=1 Tax=Jiulongibacter sp. NS-SX5 TaxID=3463854 RepID=UPI00405A09C6